MIVGVTATREGLTPAQRQEAQRLIRMLKAKELHHGDCVGGDADLHDIATVWGAHIVIHPPKDPKLRAFCGEGDPFSRILEPKYYIQRNHDIVNASDVMIGFPKEDVEPPAKRGQGTWSTIRFARSKFKHLFIAWPNGTVTYEAGK